MVTGTKFSELSSGGDLTTGDEIVGLRAGNIGKINGVLTANINTVNGA